MRWGGVSTLGRIARIAVAFALAVPVAGCFQPLYGTAPITGAPTLRDALRTVDVAKIAARDGNADAFLAVQVRNDLLFDFTGGEDPPPPKHRLRVQLSGSLTTLSIDRGTALPTAERYSLSASYSLTEIVSGKVVASGSMTTYVPIQAVGTQRFARIRGIRDAQSRAAKTLSTMITTRLASYFAAGT